MLLLTRLQNTEAWESEKTLADMEKYFWDINQSRTKMISLIRTRKQVEEPTCLLAYFHQYHTEANMVLLLFL